MAAIRNDNYKEIKKLLSANTYKNLQYCKDDGIAIYDHLKSIGYEVPDHHKLIGKVEYSEIHARIIEFFTDETVHAC